MQSAPEEILKHLLFEIWETVLKNLISIHCLSIPSTCKRAPALLPQSQESPLFMLEGSVTAIALQLASEEGGPEPC